MPESQQHSRGRPAASKPLYAQTTTSSKLKSVSSTAAKEEGSAKKAALVRTQSTRSVATSANPVTRSNSSADVLAPSQEPSDSLKVTKLSSTTVKISSSSWTPPPPPPKVSPAPVPQRQEPSTTDSLHLAAQVYSWTYMSSTLDACFKTAEEAAMNDLETKKEELAAEEAEISELRERLDAQRAIEFYDELGSEPFVKEAPAIMQQFHSHGDSCAKIETEVLNLATTAKPNVDDEELLKPYSRMLDELEQLQNQAESLHISITKLTERAVATPDKNEEERSNESPPDTDKAEASVARQQVVSIFVACLPVLKARIANLSMAQDLVDSALENASLSLRMESMGIAH